MGLFDFLRSRKPLETISAHSLDNLRLLVDLVVREEDAAKLTAFLEETSRSQLVKGPMSESDVFTSQELIDFMYETPIYFYGFFDWKDHSREFDHYVRKALKHNVNLDLPALSVTDLDKLPSIPQVYGLYGATLEEHRITLCHVDIDSDSYQVLLVRTDVYPAVVELVEKLGYRVKHHREEW